MVTGSADNIERRVKIIGVIVTVAGLLFGIVQFVRTQAVEAAKPYLEKKLEWCEEATETAASIATRARASVPLKVERFWELYWGVMGLVEDEKVTGAMIDFGEGLGGKGLEEKTLKDLSLAIAHACRHEMAKDWSPIWSR